MILDNARVPRYASTVQVFGSFGPSVSGGRVLRYLHRLLAVSLALVGALPVVAGVLAALPAASSAQGPASAPKGRLVEKYTTANSDTYGLPNGHMLTRVYAKPVNYRDAAGRWRPLSEAQTGTGAQAETAGQPSLGGPVSPLTSPALSVNAERNPLGQENEAACTLTSTAPSTSACNELTFKAGYESSSKSTRRALIQFVLPELHEELILLNAQLELYVTSTTTTTSAAMGAYRVTTPWTTKATWSTSNGSTSWHTPGGDYANPEKESDAVVNPSVGASRGWTYWYPTRMVQEWYNGLEAPSGQGQADLGFLLKDVSEGATNNVVSFAGREERERNPGLTLEWVQRGVGDSSRYTILPMALSETLNLNVNAASGNLMIHNNDIQIPEKGLEFDSARNWNSLQNEAPGYGFGWVDSNAVYIHVSPDGSVAYTDATGDTFPFIKQGSNFLTPPGIEATMCAAGSASPCPASLPSGTAYRLIYTKTQVHTDFGNKAEYDYPIDVQDQTGDTLTAHYTSGLEEPTSWTDTEGGKIVYTESETKGYTKITDEAHSRTTNYTEEITEDGLYHLVKYTDANGKQTSYSYGTELEGNLLRQITEPTGTVIKLYYDSNYRVTKIIRTTNPEHTTGPTTTYTYYERGKAPPPCTFRQKATVVTEPEGNMITYCANVLDEVEKVGHQAILGDGPATTIDYSAYDDEIPVAINVVNGNAILTTEDIRLPNADDVSFARTLNTLSETATDLGPGWQQNWGPDVSLLAQPGGSYVFVDPSGYRETFTPNGSGGYTPVDSGFGTLTSNSGTWVLATSGGDTFTFNSSGSLTAYEDATGGRFQPSYTSVNGVVKLAAIQDPGGTKTTLKYNEDGTIAEAVTPSGEHYHYGYITGWQPNVRLLASAKNETNGVTTSISYGTSPWLPTEIAVSDGHKTKLSYDSSDRIAKVEQIDPSTSSDVTTTVTYSSPTNPACEASDVGETTVSGGQGEGEQVYCYNAAGRVTNQYGGD
jgi:YD repeat-containing protein